MADTKISALTAATGLLLADELPVNEAGASKKVTGAMLTPVDRWQYFQNGRITVSADVTGTGSVTQNFAECVHAFATGATMNSTANQRNRLIEDNSAIGKVRRVGLGVYYINNTAVHTELFVTNENSTTEPTLTIDHLGIKQVDGVWSFSTADGTTEQTTDISAWVAVNVGVHFAITFDGTTARCFINGTLRVTHSANVPRAVGLPWVRAFITNTAGANKQMNLHYFNVDIAV